jgi:hypothetical protein
MVIPRIEEPIYLAPKAPRLRTICPPTVLSAQAATTNSRPSQLKGGNAIAVVPMLVAIAIEVIKTTSAMNSKATVTFCTRLFTDERSMDPAFRLALIDINSI